ncbi:hypothetical protein NDU88_006177 [Pleurodeles waltl]|uniref:Secreted protein n=1 Tax=Pleurodeles waltl TaxID=8319 RepID=A0AAV7WWU4_PLEWA|nr:hypothetical protein NDU88_006177 [Pleurodeles waltl]
MLCCSVTVVFRPWHRGGSSPSGSSPPPHEGAVWLPSTRGAEAVESRSGHPPRDALPGPCGAHLSPRLRGGPEAAYTPASPVAPAVARVP